VATSSAIGEQIRKLEVEGFVVLPGVLGEKTVRGLRELIAELPLSRSSYTDKQWFRHNIQLTDNAHLHDLIAHPRILDFLDHVLGDDLVCVGASCSRSEPGYPGMPLHTDSHPYGSNILGAVGTSPVLLRVLCYLDDLTPDRSPLRVVPTSHLSLHRDAMPYHRYRSHAEEIPVTCRSGDVVVINQRLFHGAGANRSARARRMVAVTYRPGWAGPTHPMTAPSDDELAGMPERIRDMLRDPNKRTLDANIANSPDRAAENGGRLGPNRWSD
jgi:ectoine hydroxylase-related dioxygenase (phytanoyl-CoA dioxygenase family)